ncbi:MULTISPECIES: family 10 glycosylhydrolase [unclassified Dysgonomonas]|uniref:family 10 glycosylhydrolase n=1 Tax=unclassified Dysgonomonas TaxID=2630389 RepID=UPI000AC07F42|nr:MULTISPECIES: family 10 glycosylhydrolase [unclassified Dysgonomonas]
MMKNRDYKFFLVCLMALLFAFPSQIFGKDVKEEQSETQKTHKFWVWLNPDDKDTDKELAVRYKKYYDAGIKGIFFEADNERHFKIAKAQGLETHRWMWIMNRGEQYLKDNHPDWYAINRKGESCFDQPPYVDYYRWLCPSRPEVVEYLKNDVEKALSKDYVDGIHLDYIRYSDVILAVNLWQVYGIVQTQELPQYDYCYCDVCKKKFQEKYGESIDSIEYPQESLSWKKFRYDAVTNVVNELTKVAKSHDKAITAAVFPTPDVAKRLVRQDWTNWDLTAIYPMIYHGFYKEKTAWIGTAVQEGLKGLNGRFPLYAGLFVPDFKDKDDLRDGIRYALDNGAAGVSIFGQVDDEMLALLKEFN